MAGPFEKIRQAWQAGGLKELEVGYPSIPGRNWWYMPQGAVDTRGVGNGLGNSAVCACLIVKGRAVAEAPIRVFERVEGAEEEVSPHSIDALLARPNPYMTADLLWGYTVTACDAEGDSYWVKRRSAAGRVVELWPLLPSLVTPEDENGALARDGDQGKLIAYYEYAPDGIPVRIETFDMVHLRQGLDPANHRQGLAPLKTVLREIVGDEEAGQFSASLVTNMGIPGIILSPDDPNDQGPTPEEAEVMSDVFQSKFAGRNRGRPYIPTGRMKPHVVSFSPEQMDFKNLRRVPEERISAVLGVPAILAGLGAGLDRATYSNAGELREFFTETTVTGLWKLFQQQLSIQLLPDFDTSPNRSLRFDTSDVRALQPDEDKAWSRVDAGVRGGWATVADARRAAGLEVEPQHEIFLRPLNTVEVPADGQPADEGSVPTVDELEEMIA